MPKLTKYKISNWQKKHGNFLVKSFSLNDQGKLIKNQPGIIYSGTAYTFDVPSLEALKEGLSRLTPETCIGLGNCSQEEVKIVTKKNDGKDGALARTKDNFKFYHNQPSFCFFDMDHVSESPQEAIKILSQVVPGFDVVKKLIVFSSSSGLINSETNETLSNSTSAHIYFQVKDGSDIPRFMEAVFNRLVLAGHGKIEISGAPACLKRSIIDQAIAAPERLVYEGPPMLGDGLKQDRPEPLIIDGAEEYLDTAATKSLDDEEEKTLSGIWTELTDQAMPVLNEARETKGQRIAKERSITIEEAREIVHKNEQLIIEDSLTLFFEKHGAVLVADTLDNGQKYDCANLADPLEPSYDGGSLTKAKFYYNRGKYPKVNSNAHGGLIYNFARFEMEQEEKKKEHSDFDAAIAKYNKKFAAIIIGGKFAILSEQKSQAFDGKEYRFLQKTAFLDFYCNDTITVDSGGELKDIEVTRAWLKNKNRRSYTGLVFDPSQKKYPAEMYNIFDGFKMQPKKGDCENILDMMFNGACNGDPQLFDYLCAWFAQIIKTPWKKTGVALIFSSGQGCGKGLLVQFFEKILKGYYLHVIDSHMITGKNNALLEGKLLVYSDESIFAGDKVAAAKLKGLITEDSMKVEDKYVPAYIIDNYVNLIISSNDTHVANLEADDRRHAVFAFNEDHKNDWNFFDPIWQELRAEGPSALMHYLLEQNYSHIKLNEIPETAARNDQKRMSLDSVQSFWLEILSRGYLITPDNRLEDNAVSLQIKTDNPMIVDLQVGFDWMDNAVIRSSFIYDEYLLFCRDTKVGYPESSSTFWIKTKRKGGGNCVFKDCIRRKRKSIGMSIVISTLEKMREDFCENVCLVDWKYGKQKVALPF